MAKQAANVDRVVVMDASVSGDLAPSGILDTLGSIAKVAVPIISSFI